MKHLTTAQRHTIECLLSEGKTQTVIAKTIGRYKSVISRDIKRNCDQRNKAYRSDLAVVKCAKRHKDKAKYRRFSTAIKCHVDELYASKLKNRTL